jgi:acetyl esterase/lipase
MSTTLEADATHEILVEDIEYQRQNGRALLARLYRPLGAGPFPAVVEVHGGAWVNSDRLNNEALATEFARSGIIVLSLDFRMPPDAAYPASLQDINLGIRWLKAHARQYGANPDRIGTFGTSSGGHQVLLAAMRPRDPRYAALPLADAPDLDAGVAFVISAWGVLDPLARYRLAEQQGNAQMLANHHAFWGTEAAMAEGSPPLILARGEAATLPPALVFQGDADEWVPTEVAEQLAAGWRRAGGTMELALYPGEGHTFVREKPDAPNSRHAVTRVKAFIRAHGA